MQSAPTEGGWQFPDGDRSRRPDIPDHELFRCIGRGAYGEVWLARNVFGSWRAVKVVWRDSFASNDPYEREFRGIQRYEPVSRSSDGLVDILQAGRQDGQGCFYYVMELADDAQSSGAMGAPAPAIDPDTYVPGTLTSKRRVSRRLPVADCLQLGLSLTSALGHLHRNGLIHRDIKPSNIIFVQGVAKLADIGLVTVTEEALSFVGTEGFIPPEGPTSPQADLYSLGKVLYEVSMGKDRKEYPEPMTGLHDSLTREEQESLMELNAVILKACAESIAERYQSAEEMQADLALLQSGKSVKWRQLVEKRLAAARKIGLAVAVIATLATSAWFYQRHQTSEAQRQKQIAEEQTAKAQRQTEITEEMVVRLQIQKAETLLQRGESPAGLAWLAHVLRRHPDQRVAAERIMAVLQQRRFFRPEPATLLHPAFVSLARFSPDGTTIVTAAVDGCIRFWDPQTGTEKCPPYAQAGAVQQLTFSPDGRRVLLASANGTVCVLDTGNGGLVFPPMKHESPVWTATFSPDGAWFATGTKNAMLRRFSALTGEPAGEALPVAGEVNAVQFSRDSSMMAIALEDGSGEVRTTVDDKLVHRFELSGPGRRLAFSPDGKWLAVAAKNSTDKTRKISADWDLTVWETASGQAVAGPLIHDHVTSLMFSPDSTRLVTSDTAGVAVVWRVPSGGEVYRVPHASAVRSAVFSSGGESLLTASTDHTVRMWHSASGTAAAEPILHPGPVYYAEFSSDSTRVLTVPLDSREVRLWSLPQPRDAALLLPHDRWVVSASFDAAGRSALTATGTVYPMANPGGAFDFDDPQSVIVWDAATAARRSAPDFPVPWEAVAARCTGAGARAVMAARKYAGGVEFYDEARLWDMDKGVPIGEVLRLTQNITCADISADGSKAAVSAEDGVILIIDAANGQALLPPLTGNGRLNSLRFSPDGTLLVTAAGDGTVRILDTRAGDLREGPIEHGAGVWFAQFSPAGDRIVTLPLDGTAKVWSLAGKLVAECRHPAKIEYAEFSPDGTKLVTASGDRTARLWDAATGRQLTEEPLEHAHSVLTARFSPDGLRIVTASLDKTARLWDAATGLALSDPLRHEDEVLSAAFSADGHRVITASLDRTAAIWTVQVAGRRIPGWLPELAEAVGGLRLNDRVPEPVPRDDYVKLKTRLTNLPDSEPHVELVRKCLGP